MIRKRRKQIWMKCLLTDKRRYTHTADGQGVEGEGEGRERHGYLSRSLPTLHGSSKSHQLLQASSYFSSGAAAVPQQAGSGGSGSRSRSGSSSSTGPIRVHPICRGQCISRSHHCPALRHLGPRPERGPPRCLFAYSLPPFFPLYVRCGPAWPGVCVRCGVYACVRMCMC